MDDSERRQTQDWLNALENRELEANLMEAGDSRAWFKEFGDQFYVYYEEGKFDDENPTRRLIGCVATRDLDGLSPEESHNRLLDSAMAPVVEKDLATDRLRALMGLSSYARPTAKPKFSIEVSHDSRFINEMSFLTGIDHETIAGLGLQNFRSSPFKSRADKTVYLISRLDLDGEWPALKYHIPRQKWGHRLLQSYEVLSMEGFKDKEYKASLIRNSGWTPISYSNIVRICDKLGEQQQANSL